MISTAAIDAALAQRFLERLGPNLGTLLRRAGCSRIYVAGGCAHRTFADVDIFPHPDFVIELANAAVTAAQQHGGTQERDTVKVVLDDRTYQLCPCVPSRNLTELISGFEKPRDMSGHTFWNVIHEPPVHISRRIHPTEKPVPLLRHLIAACPGATVIDPFAGSGATLEAALREGRRAIGCEVSPEFYNAAAQRLTRVADEVPIVSPDPGSPIPPSQSLDPHP